MVAKSYAELEQLGEPFSANGKMYVNVRMKSGATKSVRWYNEKEYARMYPEAKRETADPYFKTQREIFGFMPSGYITIFKAGMDEEDPYLKYNKKTRYCRFWGWYLICTEPIPEDLPSEHTPLRLYWKDVGGTDGELYPEDKVFNAVEQVRHPTVEGRFIGSVGERLDLTLTVDKAIPLESCYGHSTMHVMTDIEGNTFIWITGAKNWAVGSMHTLRGTIKEQRIYNGVAQNVLTRCSEK